MADHELEDFHPSDFLHEDDPYRGLSPSPTSIQPLLNDARLLFVLATEPSRVLPEGKTLASVFSDPSEVAQKPLNPLEEQISEMVHQAFWDEVSAWTCPVPRMYLVCLAYLTLLHRLSDRYQQSNRPL